MKNFSEECKIDNVKSHATGSTLIHYGFPNFDMSDYDRANFIINAPLIQMTTATAAGNPVLLQCAVYSATAATSTALTALTSATASFGSTASAMISGANMLMFTFNTASTGTTFSMCGKQLTIQSTHCTLTASATNYDVLGGTGLTNATYASALAAIINGTYASFSKSFVASTAGPPVGGTWNSTNTVFVWPKDPGSTVLSATGYYGASADKGVLVAGACMANIGVPADKLPSGGRYITVGVFSTEVATPYTITLVRSRRRYAPGNEGLAVNTELGSTS